MAFFKSTYHVERDLTKNRRQAERAMVKRDNDALLELIERAKKVVMTEEQTTEQRRSFAYGNSAFENPAITKKIIDDEAERIGL